MKNNAVEKKPRRRRAIAFAAAVVLFAALVVFYPFWSSFFAATYKPETASPEGYELENVRVKLTPEIAGRSEYFAERRWRISVTGTVRASDGAPDNAKFQLILRVPDSQGNLLFVEVYDLAIAGSAEGAPFAVPRPGSKLDRAAAYPYLSRDDWRRATVELRADGLAEIALLERPRAERLARALPLLAAGRSVRAELVRKLLALVEGGGEPLASVAEKGLRLVEQAVKLSRPPAPPAGLVEISGAKVARKIRIPQVRLGPGPEFDTLAVVADVAEIYVLAKAGGIETAALYSLTGFDKRYAESPAPLVVFAAEEADAPGANVDFAGVLYPTAHDIFIAGGTAYFEAYDRSDDRLALFAAELSANGARKRIASGDKRLTTHQNVRLCSAALGGSVFVPIGQRQMLEAGNPDARISRAGGRVLGSGDRILYLDAGNELVLASLDGTRIDSLFLSEEPTGYSFAGEDIAAFFRERVLVRYVGEGHTESVPAADAFAAFEKDGEIYLAARRPDGIALLKIANGAAPEEIERYKWGVETIEWARTGADDVLSAGGYIVVRRILRSAIGRIYEFLLIDTATLESCYVLLKGCDTGVPFAGFFGGMPVIADDGWVYVIEPE